MKMCRVHPLQAWLFGLLTLYQQVAVASSTEYEVDGELTQTIFEPNGRAQLENQCKFTVYVKGCSWLIQTRWYESSWKRELLRETGCINGTEIYEVFGPVDRSPVGKSHLIQPWNMAEMISNNVPVGHSEDYLVCHIWEMFASGCYFNELTTSRITPVYDLNAHPTIEPDLKREAKWQLIDGPGSLPKIVTYFENEAGQDTNAIYIATGVTNVGSLQIPSGFEFEWRIGAGFAPGPATPGSSRPAYGIRSRAIAKVTAVRPTCSRKDLSPSAVGKTVVIDERQASPSMTNPAANYYVVQNGVKWLPTAEAKVAVVSHNPERKKFGWLILLILLLPAPFFIFAIKAGRAREKD
jgi:hypothetical protein